MFVYILEAHASDEWPIGDVTSIPQHRTIAARAEAARECLRRYPALHDWTFVLDDMTDSFARTFAAWPIRFFVANHHARLTFIANTEQGGFFDLQPVIAALEQVSR